LAPAMSAEDLDIKARLRTLVRERIRDLVDLGYPAESLAGMNLVELDELAAQAIALNHRKERAIRDLMRPPGP
jgi:hypothetical protein